MSNIYEPMVAAGAGRMAYLLYISGMPWAVATSKDAIDAVNASTTAQRKMFGQGRVYDDATETFYPADIGVKIFPFLEPNSLGRQTIKSDEAKGISISGWRCNISDKHTGYDWPHSIDDFWGLEGLHRIADFTTGTHFSAVLTGSLAIGALSFDATVTSTEDSYDTWKALITSNDYAYLWIGRECLAINSVSGTFPDITFTIAENGATTTGRGLFKTKIQNHLSELYTDYESVLTSAPGSIIGRYCSLYAIPLDIDGNLIADDIPVKEARFGIVSEDVSSRNGLTRLKINSPLDALKEDTETIEGDLHLDRYVLTRGSPAIAPDDDDLYDVRTATPFGTGGVYEPVQCPHLVIHQWDIGESEYRHHAIWLCETSTTVQFDTLDDLYDALQIELNLCFTSGKTTTNGSSNAGADVPFTVDGFVVDKKDGYLYFKGGEVQELVYITGPLAIYLGLSPRIYVGNEPTTWYPRDVQRAIVSPNEYFTIAGGGMNEIDFAFFSCYDGLPHGSASSDRLFQVGIHGQIYNIDDTAWKQDIPTLTNYNIPLKYRQPKYLYQWQWNSFSIDNDVVNPPGGFRDAYDSTQGSNLIRRYYPRTSGAYDAVKQINLAIPGSGKLYFRKGTDVSVFSADDVWQGGHRSGFMAGVYEGTVESTGNDGGDSGDYPYIVADDVCAATSAGPYNALRIENKYDKKRKTYPGMTIFYNPAIHAFNQLWVDDLTAVEFTSDEIDVDGRDPFIIRAGSSAQLNTTTLSDIFKALLGDSSIHKLSATITIEWVTFFNDSDNGTGDGEFKSHINWDEFDAVCSELPWDHTYRLPLNDPVNIFKIWKVETLFHRATPTWYWDSTLAQWMIGFRKIGPMNSSKAIIAGRELTIKKTIEGTAPVESHNDKWTYRALNLKANREENEHQFETNLKYRRSYAVPLRDSENVLKVESWVSNIPSFDTTDPATYAELYTFYGAGMLRYLAEPQPSNKTEAAISALNKLPVGKEILVTDPATHLPYTHVLGITRHTAMVTSFAADLSKNIIRVKYRLGMSASFGWAPAARVQAGNSTKIGSDTITCLCDDHYFTALDNNFKDWHMFDCLEVDEAGNATERTSCGCSNYSVFVVGVTSIGSAQTVYDTLASVDVDAGLVTLTMPTASYNDWSTDNEYVLIFGLYDSIQSCQKNWVIAADDSGTIGSEDNPPHLWV